MSCRVYTLQLRSKRTWEGSVIQRVRLLVFHPVALALIVSIIAIGCDSSSISPTLRQRLAALGIESVEAPNLDQDLVDLGQLLFFDKILGGNMDMACATCHHPSLVTADGIPLAIGVDGTNGLGPDRDPPLDGSGNPIFIPRNTPEVFNRAGFLTMFWDARIEQTVGGLLTPAGTALLPGLDSALAAQAMFPVTSRAEMRGQVGESELGDLDNDDLLGMWDALMVRILGFPEYVTLFAAAYPGVDPADLTFVDVANAIAAFETQHWTLPDAPFDRWLDGDDTALTDMQLAGAELFFDAAGCSECHSGTNFTDEMFHNTGVPQLGPGKGDGASGMLDFGRERVTGDMADRYRFRTPPLRNVAVTFPYMHDGAFADLEDVVRRYNDIADSATNYDVTQLSADLQALFQAAETANILMTLDEDLPDIDLSDEEIDQIVAFLNSLTAPGVFMLVANDVPATVPSGLPVD